MTTERYTRHHLGTAIATNTQTTATHILGTDHLGRDVLSRTLHGAWISLYIGIGSVLIGITAGFVLGVVTAYAGGIADMAFQRLVDAMMTISGLIIALAIVAVLGASLNNVILAIVIGMVAPVVRTVRSQVLSVKEMDYVLAAKSPGRSTLADRLLPHYAQLLRYLPYPGHILFRICHHH